jgi:hypothetical protein
VLGESNIRTPPGSLCAPGSRDSAELPRDPIQYVAAPPHVGSQLSDSIVDNPINFTRMPDCRT